MDLTELAQIRSSTGTTLISLIIPDNMELSAISTFMTSEYATSANIRSRV